MTEPRAIDHIVFVTDDLDATATKYENLGFTLTPRAQHNAAMGTSNRLIQFEGRNYIELLEVDRPDGVAPHRFDADPPFFSFGTHNKEFLRRGAGISMLALKSTDLRTDLMQLARNGVQTYAPLDFERQAQLPDGSEVSVAFSLGFVSSPSLPGLAFFLCQHHTPQYFWNPEFQIHKNAARSASALYLASNDPEQQVDFLSKLTGGVASAVHGGFEIACAESLVFVLTPNALSEVASGFDRSITTPAFAGAGIEASARVFENARADHCCGAFLMWTERDTVRRDVSASVGKEKSAY
ncbi:MAG: VOC family protein [Kiloniellaceae bacterium]